MITLALVVLLFALLIGIFVRSGKSRDRKTGVTCPSCRSNIDPQAIACPHCLRNVDRAAVHQQLKRGQIRAFIGAGLAVAGLIWLAANSPASPEPLPVPQRQGGSCPNGYLASGSYCVPSSSRQDAIPKPRNGSCPWGWLASGSYCMRSGANNR
jgi:hypothetical protein